METVEDGQMQEGPIGNDADEYLTATQKGAVAENIVAGRVYSFSLFFYSPADEPVRFRNLRLVKKEEDAEGDEQ